MCAIDIFYQGEGLPDVEHIEIDPEQPVSYKGTMERVPS